MRNVTASLHPAAKVLLLFAAFRLGDWILDSTANPQPVAAQSGYEHLYIEPGTTLLRDPERGGQVQGKIVVDRRTGDIYGFPTATNVPYPISAYRDVAPVSKPVYLGRFDFGAMKTSARQAAPTR